MNMTFMNFYDIACYVNSLNRNCFSSREVAECSYDYYYEYRLSIFHPTKNMIALCKLLVEDMDYMDYADLENNLDIEAMEKILKETLYNL